MSGFLPSVVRAVNGLAALRGVWVCGLALVLAGEIRAQGTGAPPAVAKTKPFLTAGKEVPAEKLGWGEKYRVVQLLKDGVEEPFNDVPFALNVPVEVRHEGGAVRILWQARVMWDEPPAEWKGDVQYRFFSSFFGLYRLDGRKPAPGSVRCGNGEMKWDEDAPQQSYVSLLALPDKKTVARSHSIQGEKGPHKPFAERGDSLLLQPAEPGAYALWLSVDASATWPDLEPKREVMTGRFLVDVLIVRGDREPSSEEIDYLFGRGKKPVGMMEDKFFHASTAELPFRLRRDEWVFDHAEARPIDREFLEKKRIAVNPGYIRNFESAQKISGKEMELHLVEKVQTEPRGEVPNPGPVSPGDRFPHPTERANEDSFWEVVHVNELNWKVSFPASVPDHGFGILKFTGGREARFKQKPDWQPETPVQTYWWEPYRTDLPKEKKEEPNKSSEYVSEILYPLTREQESGAKEIQADFLKRYGKDAAEWCAMGFFENRGSGPKKGEPPFQYVVRGIQPRKAYDVMNKDIGAYPLLSYKVGAWHVVGYYRRLSEIEGRVVASTATPGDTTLVLDADEFWKWLPGLSAVIAVQSVRADKAVADAGLVTMPLQKLLHSKNRLMASLAGDGLSPAGVFENVSAALDNNFPRINVGTLPGGSEPGSVNTPVSLSAEETLRTRNKLGQITEDIRHCREKIEDCIADARDAYQKILDKLGEGNEKFGGPAHGELYVWRILYRKTHERIPFDIALASKDPAVLKKALADAEIQANTAQTRLLEAQLNMALGDRVGALYALRSAVRVDPKNSVAAKMLKDLECAFLKAAIDKSQGTIREVRAAFYGYMLERGFAAQNTIRVSGDWPFARAMSWSTQALQVYGEVPWAVFTTGLFGSFSSFSGKLEAEEVLLDTNQKRMVTAFVGLNTILRLRNNGYTLDRISGMTSTEIRDGLPLRDAKGNPYSDKLAAGHRTAIRAAMDLPDVQALVTDDRLGLQLGLQKAYWNNKDVGDTWLEWIGDATSMYNLLLMLPGAKAGTAGRMTGIFWGEAELEMIQAYEKSGQVVSGTEFVANTIGLASALGAAGATESGQVINAVVKWAAEYQQGLKWYDKVVWTTGKLTGLLTINCVTVLTTEKLAGHKAAMLMQAALMFGADTETLAKALETRNIAPRKVAELIINDYLPATQLHIKRLAMIEKSRVELEGLFERVKRGLPLKREDFVFLDRSFGSDWQKLVPNGQASHDASIALDAAAQGLRNGVNNGAHDAVRAMEDRLKKEAADTAASAANARKVADGLYRRPTPVLRGPKPPDAPPVTPRDLQRVPALTKRDASGMLNFPHPPTPRVRSMTAKAERYLHEGEFMAAQNQYEKVIDLILDGTLQEADELPLEWLHLKRCLAYELQAATRKIPKGRSVINNAIPAAEAEAIFGNRGSWRARAKSESGAMSEVFNVDGNDNYFVKEVHSEFDYVHPDGRIERKQIDVLADVQGNVVHAELARALGFDVPAMEVRLFYNAKGEVGRAVYVMRKVNGRRLSDLSAAEIFLYKGELSRHRALSVLVGDYDRKIDNYMVTGEGHLVPIDAGLSDVTGRRTAGAGWEIDDPSTLEGINGRDHWLSRFFKDECGKGPDAPAIELWEPHEEFARKGMIAELSLTTKAAAPTVRDIEDLVIKGLPSKVNGKKIGEIIDEAHMKIVANEGDINRLMDREIKLKADAGIAVDLNDPQVVQEMRGRAAGYLKTRIQEPAAKTMNLLHVRAPKIGPCMDGLNARSGRAKGGVSQIRRAPAGGSDSRIVFIRNFNAASLRLAA